MLDAPVARIRAHLDEGLAHQRPEHVRQGRYPDGQVAGENLETLPSVHDLALWDSYDAACAALFNATQNGKPAPRYLAAQGLAA